MEKITRREALERIAGYLAALALPLGCGGGGEDTEGPAISNVIVPSDYYSDDSNPKTVEADVSDESGVSDVYLEYKRASEGSFSSIPMVYGSGKYMADLPLLDSDIWDMQIRAFDTKNNESLLDAGDLSVWAYEMDALGKIEAELASRLGSDVNDYEIKSSSGDIPLEIDVGLTVYVQGWYQRGFEPVTVVNYSQNSPLSQGDRDNLTSRGYQIYDFGPQLLGQIQPEFKGYLDG